jgi:hypothetical protein
VNPLAQITEGKMKAPGLAEGSLRRSDARAEREIE